MWVDPYSQTFIIGLSNRLHPRGKPDVRPLWATVSSIVDSIVRPGLEGVSPRRALSPRAGAVLPGIDVLRRDAFQQLRGRKVGLITNATGINRDGFNTVDLLHRAPGVHLRALFAPEHGIRTDVDVPLASAVDAKTGLKVHSLYGPGRYKPTPAQLKGLDTLVFDIQDVGLRYYTYITTLALAMDAARENGLRFVVLDRPNPIGGVAVDGPLLEPASKSFIGHHRLPVRHGLTVGELARLYKGEFTPGCDLVVVPMENWRRGMRWAETGLPWVNPSPNIRSPLQAELYAGIGLLEGANLSVGRGTPAPFERFGAPWIDGERLARELRRRDIPGVGFTPIVFTPTASVYQGQQCGGVRVRPVDRDAFQGTRMAIEVLDALNRLYPGKVKLADTHRWFGTRRIPAAIAAGRSPASIVESYQADMETFRRLREPYLLYP
jgi:uncharacterized protein YbbC (DUF1343 family)